MIRGDQFTVLIGERCATWLEGEKEGCTARKWLVVSSLPSIGYEERRRCRQPLFPASPFQHGLHGRPFQFDARQRCPLDALAHDEAVRADLKHVWKGFQGSS